MDGSGTIPGTAAVLPAGRGRRAGIAYPNQQQTDGNPEEFAQAGYQARQYAVSPAHAETAGDDGQTALAGAHLHGNEEQEVGEQGHERLHEQTIPVGDVAREDEENELQLEASDEAGEELQRQAQVERGTTAGVKFRYLGIHLAYALGVSVGEGPHPTPQKGPAGEEVQHPHGQSVAVALQKEVDAQQAEGRDGGQQEGQRPRQRAAVTDEEDAQTEEPETEVREDVHHGIEYDTARRPRLADVGG